MTRKRRTEPAFSDSHFHRAHESFELILVPEVDVVVLVAATDVLEMVDHLWCS